MFPLAQIARCAPVDRASFPSLFNDSRIGFVFTRLDDHLVRLKVDNGKGGWGRTHTLTAKLLLAPE